jgi:hypothetical protein
VNGRFIIRLEHNSHDESDERPTCKQEREDAKRVIEQRLRRDREEKDRLIRDVEEWLGG